MIDVDKLEAGPEIDALVAEKVMGWKPDDDDGHAWEDADGDWKAHRKDGPWMDTGEVIWSPSTDIAAAWEVVEKFSKFRIDNHGHYDDPKLRYMCEVYDEARDLHSGRVFGETAPLAICRAALRAVGA